MKAACQMLVPGQCCLLVIDPQEKLMANIHGAMEVTANTALMLRAAGILKFPILATTQYAKGIGPMVAPLQELLEDVPTADKTEFNALANADVQKLVKALPSSIDTLLLCGVESHICVYQTAAAALGLGYRVRIVADAVSSRTRENDRFGKERMAAMGAVMAPAEMLIYEMLSKAGTPEFKAILPFVR